MTDGGWSPSLHPPRFPGSKVSGTRFRSFLLTPNFVFRLYSCVSDGRDSVVGPLLLESPTGITTFQFLSDGLLLTVFGSRGEEGGV